MFTCENLQIKTKKYLCAPELPCTKTHRGWPYGACNSEYYSKNKGLLHAVSIDIAYGITI